MTAAWFGISSLAGLSMNHAILQYKPRMVVSLFWAGPAALVPGSAIFTLSERIALAFRCGKKLMGEGVMKSVMAF